MRSPCRSNGWRRELALLFLAATSCEHERNDAALSGEPHLNVPASEAKARKRIFPEAEAEPTAQQVAVEPLPSPSLALAVYDSLQPDVSRTRFSIASTRELRICASWSALEGEHFETRQFYSPQGELYYQKLIPFSTDIDQPYPFTQPVSIPHATVIQPVVPNEHGELVICDELAVAGAWIGDHQITGNWRLEVSLDGAKTSTASHHFEITP